MSSPLRASATRAIIGGSALVIALAVAYFFLSDAGRQLKQERDARDKAKVALDLRGKDLERTQNLSERLDRDRAVLARLEAGLPSGSAGDMQWQLSRELHDLATKHGIRLQAIKYSPPAREGGTGSTLEAVDVDFSALGVYPNLKAFMRALEGSGLPFAAREVRLEESPEGARLQVVLRAFRRSGSPGDKHGEKP